MLPPFVDGAFLRSRREKVTLADVRWCPDGRPAAEGYRAGHLRDAVFVDLEAVCCGRIGGGRHPLPHPGDFAASMGALGIGDDDTVIAYDDSGGVMAARLVWMLRSIGHAAALLDGGMAAADEPLETGPGASRPERAFTQRPWPSTLLAGLEDVTNRENVVLDARDRARYEGTPHPLDRLPGHVPGARSVPCRENLDGEGRLLAETLLAGRFSRAGVGADTAPVVYCGSGVTACHDLLVLEHVGLGRGRLYPGSWSEYTEVDQRPRALGAEPG